jgi:hypothetical protein
MAVIRALKTEKGFIKSYKRAIKVDNKVLIANKNILRVDTIQKWNPKNVSTKTYAGLTATVDKITGIIVLSGITTKKDNLTLYTQDYVAGHKYLARSGLKGFGTSSNLNQPHFYFTYGYSGTEYDKPIIFTYNHTSKYNVFFFSAGVDLSTPMTIRPQLYDLTEIFGEGNEPNSVEKAEEELGKDYIPYQYL